MSEDTRAGNWSTGRALLAALVRELGWRLAASIAVAVALGLTEGAGLLLLIPLLGSIGLATGTGSAGALALRIEQVFAAAGLQLSLVTVLATFTIVSSLHALLQRATMLLNPSLEQRFSVALRMRVYSALVRVEWPFLVTRRMSDLIHAATADVDRASGAAYQMMALFSSFAVSVVYIAVAFRLSPSLTTVVGLAGVLLLWISRSRTARSSALGDAYADADRRQFSAIAQSLMGLKVGRAFGAEGRDLQIVDRHARSRATAYLAMLRSYAESKLWLEIATAVLISAVLLVAVQGVGLTGVSLLMLIFVFARVMPRLMAIQQIAQLVVSGLPSFASVTRLLQEAETRAIAAVSAETRGRPFSDWRSVDFDRVTFTYDDGNRRGVHDVSFGVARGRITAIVGSSGAGKSTVADLLIGLLRASSGHIRVDGHALETSDLPAWRQSIGYVPQDGFLLHDTIRANLRWARPDATDEEMWTALSNAGAESFVRDRPEGLDTIVGDRGVLLSGGERQRLALARALLVNPALLLLDEATSALDAASEQQVLAAVRRIGHRVTTLIITHRLSAIRDADTIHVMEDGRVVESGSWQALVAAKGAFVRLLAAHGLSHDAAADAPVQAIRI